VQHLGITDKEAVARKRVESIISGPYSGTVTTVSLELAVPSMTYAWVPVEVHQCVTDGLAVRWLRKTRTQ
jgi:hypothetical protein